MTHLEIKTTHDTKRFVLAGAAVTIGRQPDNMIVLTDDLASRHHCVIEPSDGGFRIRGMGSIVKRVQSGESGDERRNLERSGVVFLVLLVTKYRWLFHKV